MEYLIFIAGVACGAIPVWVYHRSARRALADIRDARDWVKQNVPR